MLKGDANPSIEPTAPSALRALASSAHVERSVAQMQSSDSPHMNPNFEVLREFFAAINRNDMESMAAQFAAQIIRVEPEGWPTAGTYTGINEVREHVRKGRETWAEGSCDPEAYFANGEKIVVYLHAHVKLAINNEWVGGRFADGFVVERGKILEYRTFWERENALAWAGITETVPE